MNEYHYSPCPTCGHQRWVPVDHVDKPNDAAKELLEACKVAVETLGTFMQNHYGQNQHVLGWHLNGDPEPLDSFLEDGKFHETIETALAAIAKAEGLDLAAQIVRVLEVEK